jgi:DNA-directed RNA polymerase subunit RPC12/RpoP
MQEDNVICPYCGYKYDDYDAYCFQEGDTPEVECEACGRKFDLEVETRRVFSTKRSLCEMPDNYGEEDTEE